MWLPQWLDFFFNGHIRKNSPKMVNPRDLDGNTEEEEESSGFARINNQSLI